MNKALAIQEQGNEYWVGADVAKASFDVALASPGQRFPRTPLRELPAATFARTEDGARQFLTWLDSHVESPETPVGMVMEATGRYSTELARWLTAKRPCLAPAIVNPTQTAMYIRSLGVRNKTDRIDARALAFYGVERCPSPSMPLDRVWGELRELIRHRDWLVRTQVAQGNRAQETHECALVRQLQKRLMRHVESAIRKLEAKARKLIAGSPELLRDAQMLQDIHGVGFVTSAVILSELGDIRRFRKARQLTAFAGLSPSVRESGSSVNRRPRMCKQGNPRVRKALFMAAMTVIRKPNDLQRMYHRMVEQGAPRMKALGAVMRKLLVLMRAVLISGRPFDPDYIRTKPCGQPCG